MAKTRNSVQTRIIRKAWKDNDFKKELLSNPRVALEKELGVKVPEGVNIKVLEETRDTVYLVLPVNPAELERMGAVLGSDGDGSVGVW